MRSMDKDSEPGAAPGGPALCVVKMHRGHTGISWICRYFIKRGKKSKKQLTKPGRGGNLTKLSDTTGRECERFQSKLEKISRNPLTSGTEYVRIAKPNCIARDLSEKRRKEIRKNLKKVLDKQE